MAARASRLSRENYNLPTGQDEVIEETTASRTDGVELGGPRGATLQSYGTMPSHASCESSTPPEVTVVGTSSEARSPSAPAAPPGEAPTAIGLPAVYAYVGTPVDPVDYMERAPLLGGAASFSAGSARSSDRRADPSIGELVRDDHARSDGDLTEASIIARLSAKRDNEMFNRSTGATQAEARRRVEEEARAFEFAQIQAKRRDSEGLSMRPHPGNRLEPVPASEKDGYGGKASAYFGGGGKGGQESEKEKSENEKNRVREQERKAEAAAAGPEAEATTSGGYDFPEYEPAEYVIPEYKSVYDI